MKNKNWLGIEIHNDEFGREYFYWKDTKARIYGGVISGNAVIYGGRIYGGEIYGDAVIYGGEIYGDAVISGNAIEYIVSYLQYRITINLTDSSAQIGCHHKTISEWLDISREKAIEMGLKEKYYDPIRNLLKKFV